MRVTYLSVSDQLGGAEMALLEILKGLRRERPSWELQAILPGRGPLLDRVAAVGADGVVVPPPASLARVGEEAGVYARWSAGARLMLGVRLVGAAAAMPLYQRRLRAALRTFRPAVVHTNGLKAHVLGARSIDDAALVWHMHDYVSHRPVTRALLRREMHRCAAILANSSSVAGDVTKTIAPRKRVRVVHNAVDLHEFSPDTIPIDLDALANLRPPAGPVVRIGLVATFARWKGHDVFFRALAALPPDLAFRAYVIGDSVYETIGSQYTKADLQQRVRELNLSDRVAFTGFAPAAGAMRALDVVVHASTRPEPFGLVIAEAMACGRAVISSGAGGAAELIEPGVDALTHRPGNAPALAACIARLAGDAALRERLGRSARATAERRFDSRRLAKEVAAVYEELTARSLQRCSA